MKMNADELSHGIAGTSASWHEQYRGNAWVFAGGLVDKLTEGDVLAVFSQYGEIEDLHLVRDQETGKSKGFSFLKYEDERSTVLAVDNLNGYMLLGKTLRVDHTDYRPPKKKKKEISIQEANGEQYVAQTSGHAYIGKDLATNHSLDAGVDVFNPAVNSHPVANTTRSAAVSTVAVSSVASSANNIPIQDGIAASKKRKMERAAIREERRVKKAKKQSKKEKKGKKKKKKEKKKQKKEKKKQKKRSKSSDSDSDTCSDSE